jgi:hypothetical protein
MAIMIPAYSMKIFSNWTTNVKDSINLIFCFLCHAIFYLPEIRSSISTYIDQSLFLASTLYSCHNTPFFVTNSLAHACRLAAISNVLYMSVLWVHLFVTLTDKLHHWYIATQKVIFEVPKDTFIITQLWSNGWCPQSILLVVLVSSIISWYKDGHIWH